MGLDPITWALIGATAFTAAGSISSANAQANAQRQKAAVNEANAAQAQAKAKYNADLHERQTQRLISTQRAAYGKSGIQLTDTPIDVISQQAYERDVDRQMTLYEGDLNAWRYRTEAGFLESSADNTQEAGYTTAFGQLVSGGLGAAAYQKKLSNPLAIHSSLTHSF